MEEVWKDICLSSDLGNPAAKTTVSNPSSTGALEGISFQEFLSRPNHHRRRRENDRHSSFGSTGEGGFFESRGQHPAATAILSLNKTRAVTPSLFSLADQLDHDVVVNLEKSSTANEFSILPKKRIPQNEDICQRYKRMIKNRESAARSRARKQAYTNELEHKVARLMEENAKLRRQQEKLYLRGPAQFPKKHKLSRTLTAPF
ncbi:hypothetical protein ACH5RR_027520 [Cinchona calisaya]|uniref:BZIP domain-containing protein n=1 Tax=Cinchona calisaya TaxID=153742 RepID=A0ABD2ZAP6_9GENT